MTTNENAAESVPVKLFDVYDAENKNGQMLVIHLPEGSVIVDRTEVNQETVPPQPMHSTLQEVVQLAVREVMQVNGAPTSSPQSTSSPNVLPRTRRHNYRNHPPRRLRLNWVHGINTLFVAYIALVLVLPAILSSFFGLSIYASKVAHPGVSISSGDLMICRVVPAVGLKVNDVVLVRDGNIWRLDVRQITSNSSDATNSTITTASTSGTPTTKTFVMPIVSSMYKVSSIVPKLGYVLIFFGATITKVIGALFILILNMTVHSRRVRRRRQKL